MLSALNLFNPKGRKLLSRLRLDLSHLNTHKFQHKSCTNPLCCCMFETETAVHFLLCCHGYTNIRITLTNDLHQINKKITLTGDNILKIRLFDYPKYGNEKIKKLQQFQLVIF